MRELLVAGATWVPLARLGLLLAAASGLPPPFAEYLVVGEGARMRTVAIACQGGGSHTAFTGGALQRLLAEGQHRIVARPGTSGGAVCALLAWYGLLTGGAAEAGRLLERFWRANSATTLSDRLVN